MKIKINNSMRYGQNQNMSTIVLFLLPTLFFLAVFVIYPILSSFNLSFLKWNGIGAAKEFIGFSNWNDLLHDKIFAKAILNNFYFVILAVVFQLPIGMALAVLLEIGEKRFNIFKTLYFFPMLMSSVAIGILFKYIYDPQFGIITALLNEIGLKSLIRNWLADPKIAIYSVIAVICWQFIPFYMVYFYSAMTTIPSELYEASKIDGASRNQYYWKVVFPLLSGYVKSAVVLVLVGSLKYFDLVYVMTEGGPVNATELMATYMYKNAFTSFKMGYGSTVASALFLIVVVISLLLFFLMHRKAREQ